MPRDNIDVLSRAARRAAANTLAALCVARGPKYAGGDDDERAILAMAAPDIDAEPASAAASTDGGADVSSGKGFDIATASEWPGGVRKEDVLISPANARSAWREFMSASTLAIQQAKITQQANLAAGKRAPPIWAVFAILFLGWNEFVAVLWNPIYLILGFATVMFGWMLYSELDVDARMQQGWIAGALSIWTNLGDALRNVSDRTINTGATLLGEGRQLLQEHGDGPGEGRRSPLPGGTPQRQQQQQQQHPSSAGLVRRKAEGVQMASFTPAFADGPKDE